jgi:predicted N-acyltransferase
LLKSFSFRIFANVAELPYNWDSFCQENIFLSSKYLKILQASAPQNMNCYCIGVYKNNLLCGIALAQILNLTTVKSFGLNKSCLQSKLRDWVFKKFASNVLFVGNNMLTGQNAYRFDESISLENFITTLQKAVVEIQLICKSKNQKIHLINYKDFYESEIKQLQKIGFKDYYQFEIQPNMIFEIPETWHSIDDYVGALSKKYRDQFKRSHKKMMGIEKRKMSLQEIENQSERIHELYMNVTKNAPFNTFYLSENHFVTLKSLLKNDFLFYGYFLEGKLIGFNTLIKNNTDVDTYFLGYDDAFQRERMLYLNMLYDMLTYGINKKFNQIIFARTALEIKSSIGAKPHRMFGFLKHNNTVVNKFLPNLFGYFEPKVVWQERSPFADKLI